MSLMPPAIYRNIGDEVPASERLIYRTFIDRLESSSLTPAVLATAKACGVSRRRVLAIIRAHNQEVFS
jgi:hypothetical protein